MAARILAIMWAPAVAAATGAGANAVQDYPNHPVRLITGSPGSTSDIAARFVGQKLSERWGQQVVVDNRPGVGGIIGAEIAANAVPDGYTLFVGHIGTHAAAQFLFKKLAYDPVRDFAPISLMTNSGIALVVHSSVPAANVKEFVAYAKAKPGGVNYASAGGGTSSQLSGELFNQMTGARLVHIPYKGAGFALTALVSGETQAAFLSTTTANAQVKAGRLRALAVLSEKRFSAAPDIPSAPEAGFPGLDSSVWFGLFAPAKTPGTVVSKVNRDVVYSLNLAEAKSALAAQGAEAVPTTPEEFGAFLKREIDKWGKVIKAAGIKAE
ncbi:MAG TPA: tripartite tricarboxylate transporter substrate binding protein [Burkholderiales bacterium]|nr:tripartite tricarboxylate transporter substrate binding protein [Burkholderiales bacterium]